MDDDADSRVDEEFRDEEGRYVHSEHCGGCNHACNQPLEFALSQECGLVEQVPTCVAVECEAGHAVSRSGRCAGLNTRVCMPCASDQDCGPLVEARCLQLGDGKYCSLTCESGCPEGYACTRLEGGSCLPAGGDCLCDAGESYVRACSLKTPAGERCPGRQRCSDGTLSECQADPELCDSEDNDCDGRIDEGFRDERGAYSLAAAHCGACGVDCSADSSEGDPLVCGGDPFAPSCVVRCPDREDGVQLGDQLDADREIETGCECVVTSLTDSPGEPDAEAQLDADCDGADGETLSSIYVAADGDDSAPGSPSRPLRSLGRAIELAALSLATEAPRPHVFVATGTYTELVRMRDGVLLHGGYRRDFLARNPQGFEVLLVAPPESVAVLGAALVIENAGRRPTLVEGLRVRGFDAADASQPALGISIVDPGPALVVRDLRVRVGQPGAGRSGADGSAAPPVVDSARSGQTPRAAREDALQLCVPASDNQTVAGAAGRNLCGGIDVSGGSGASASCPSFGAPAAGGGRGSGPSPGFGGGGGTDVRAPITGGSSCPGAVCCGLADFSVPTIYPQATPGADGDAGSDGREGVACDDPLGRFASGSWIGGAALGGTAGTPGSGGGGGGAGGGVEFDWTGGVCEFADGLGGAGGGGGAGGCGGGPGEPGQSAAPAIGVLIQASDAAALPELTRVVIETQPGASGGDGGRGGDGAPGGRGGSGGALARAALATPTLAGAAAGERGGNGGKGGAGGGAGGGCGGSNVGVWVAGATPGAEWLAQLRAQSSFNVAAGGRPGRGGGGAVPAADGAEGMAIDVLSR
jgi:hypothetical protein